MSENDRKTEDGKMHETHNISNAVRAEILTQALPYIKRYSGKTVVVKYGGNAMVSEELKQQVMEDVVLLWLIGVKVVLVHGGGPEINDLMARLGKKAEFVDGLRVTDAETVDIVQMVLAGEVYNINGDTAAACVAGALRAERLILMTDIAGILRDPKDPSTLIPSLTVEEAAKLFASGVISGGMIPKVDCCIRAISEGVQKAIIMDGRVPHSILMELLTDEGAGTMVTGGEEYRYESTGA